MKVKKILERNKRQRELLKYKIIINSEKKNMIIILKFVEV